MPHSDALAMFEQFCHEFSNPLMIISGQAFLLHRQVEQAPHLPAEEQEAWLDGLTAIARTITAMAIQIERHHEVLVAERDAPRSAPGASTQDPRGS